MKVYLKSLLIKRIPIVIALTMVLLIAVIVVNNTSPYMVSTYIMGKIRIVPKEGLFNVFNIGILVLAFVVTLIEFSFKMMRLEAAQIYAFPIKRDKVFLAGYLTGLIEVIVPFVFGYLASTVLVINSYNEYNTQAFFLYLPFAVIALVLLYSYLSFIFCRANNLIDGIASMALSIVAFLLLGLALNKFLGSFSVNGFNFYYLSPIYPLDFLTSCCNKNLLNQTKEFETMEFIFLGVWILIEILTIGFMSFYNRRIKSEDIMNESNSIYCYKVFLAIGTVCLSILLPYLVNFWSIALAPMISVALYCLYSRGYPFTNKAYALISVLCQIPVTIAMSALINGGIL